ncbi:MAG: ATP-binding protein [Thermoleophilaceae bacterium]|nr:ATP-binding protein [Thermoleophilaceae bacterium]
MATLGARLSKQDSDRFVGREAELRTVEELFVDDPCANVVLLHGPGGIGKSTFLREVARRGEAKGWTPHWVEGRDLPPFPDAVEDALEGALEEECPLILIDSYERMIALGGHLRRAVLPALPEKAIVVVAGRLAPEQGWFEGGWESLATEVELGPLSREDSAALLSAAGLEPDEAVIGAAGGSPLALALEGPGEEALKRLVEDELEGADTDALGVAAIARVTTTALLEDALQVNDAAAAYEWLATRSFTEPLGDGLAVQDLVRQAVLDDFRARDPQREKELRRRTVDHVYERAMQGRLVLSLDLAHLVENPAIRWGYGWQGAVAFRIDDVREGDVEPIAARVIEARGEDWWKLLERYFMEAPERVGIARDPRDELAGFEISVTPGNAPDFAYEDPLLGRWLEHAAQSSPDGNVVVWHDSVNMHGGIQTGVRAVLAPSGMLRSGLDNPRFAYMPINRDVEGSIEFSRVLGAQHVEALDTEVPGALIECHVVDWGPGGLLGFQRDTVYSEIGLEPPAPVADTIRDALRNFAEVRDPLRPRIEGAAAAAFGETPSENLLREILVRGYLKPEGSHEWLAEELHLSRAAYFRRLKQASDRVADYLG